MEIGGFSLPDAQYSTAYAVGEATIATRAPSRAGRASSQPSTPPRSPALAHLALLLLALLAGALPPAAPPAAAAAPAADLSIAKTSAPNPLRPGAPLTYTLLVANSGPDSARAARVLDRLPAALIGVSWSCAVSGGGACAVPAGAGGSIDVAVDLAPGATATLTIEATLSPAAAGSLESIASVRPAAGLRDPDERNNVARNITPVAPAADLELTAELLTPPGELAPGGLAELAVVLRNRGPAGAADVRVEELLAGGLELVGAAPSLGRYDSAAGAWELGTLAAGEVARLSLRARWDGSPAASAARLTRSATPDPDSAPGDADPAEDDQAALRLPPPLADLSLTLEASDPQTRVGASAVLTLRVVNAGPAAAGGVRIDAPLPPGLAFERAVESQGAYDPIAGAWALGELGAGDSATLTLVAALREAGPLTALAQVGAADALDPDSAPGNDAAGEDDMAGATVAGLLADLSLSQRLDDPGPPGGRVTLTLRLANAGPGEASGVAVRDRLPAGLTLVRAAPGQGAYTAASGVWAVGELAAGAAATLRIEAEAGPAGAALVNLAEVIAADQPDPDSAPGNGLAEEDDQAALDLRAARADVSLSLATSAADLRPGGQAVLVLTLENDGPAPASGAEVSMRLPAGLAYVGHSASQGSYNPADGRWSAGGLEAGGAALLRVRARLEGAGPHPIAAELSKLDQIDPDSAPGNGLAEEDDQAGATLLAPLADLSVSAAVAPPALPTSGELTYRARVRNDGPAAASGVRVAVRLPPGAAVLVSSAGRGTYDPTTGVWALGELGPGQAAALNLRVRAGAAPHTLAVELIAADQPDPDSAPGNGLAEEDDQAGATALAPGAPPGTIDLELSQAALRAERLDDGIAYLIRLSNAGPLDASGVEVLDRLPPGAQLIGAGASQGRYDPSTGTWHVGRLPAGASASLTLLAVSAAPQGLVNRAQVSAADQPDRDSAPNNDAAEEDDQSTLTGVIWVNLLAFEAERLSLGALITWRTGGELDVAGYHLYRSASADRAAAIRVTEEPLQARGGPRAAASYAFLDTNSSIFAPYRYWLVAVESDGELAEQGALSSPAALNEAARLSLPLLP